MLYVVSHPVKACLLMIQCRNVRQWTVQDGAGVWSTMPGHAYTLSKHTAVDMFE